MRYFHQIASGVDVAPLLGQVDAAPDLWNLHPERKEAEGTPHSEMTDIWVRYRPQHELDCPERHREPHFAEWYPAVERLPAVRAIAFPLMGLVSATYLGGILITRLPPGGVIHPHDDRGSWHAEYLNLKAYVPLRANDGCINRCGPEAIVMSPGEIWTFDNLRTHSVENNGNEERIMLIVCMRVE